MKKPTAKNKTTKKNTTPANNDTWELYPIKSNHNIVRLPIFSESDFDDIESVTFDKTKSVYSIDELKTSDSGLISGTCTLNLDRHVYDINLTYRELCKILFGGDKA